MGEEVNNAKKAQPPLGDADIGDGEETAPEPCDLPECLDCGACCFSKLDTYVRVSGDDHARMGELAERYTRFIGNRCYMRIADGRCAALRIDRSASRFICEIYDERPSICRDLARCSPECRFEHATKTSRATLALGEPDAGDASRPVSG